MKYINFLLLMGLTVTLNANDYTPSKQYTFNEVAEILSDKIIETRKKVDESRFNSLKEYQDLKTKVDDLTIKVNMLLKNQQIQQLKQVQTTQPKQVQAQPQQENKKNIESKIEEIVIDKELYEKVK